jgi:hypothetical protein
MEDSNMASEKIQPCLHQEEWTKAALAASVLPSATRNAYCRETRLQKLLPLWPHEIADRSLSGVTRIVTLLARALRSERQRGQAGHWTYDINRHLALTGALREERAALKKLSVQAEARALEHFPAKWSPLCVAEMQPNKDLERRSDAIGSENALGKGGRRGQTLKLVNIAPPSSS